MIKKGLIYLLGFLILLSSFTSARIIFDWTSYGNSILKMPDAQIGIATSNFNASNVVISNVSDGILTFDGNNKFAFQPLVSSLGSNTNFLIFPDGNFLNFYDKDLILQQQINVGYLAVSNLDLLDWDGDSNINDIAGIFKVNNSFVQFKVFRFNSSSYFVDKIYEYNISSGSYDGGITAGVRHKSNKAYFGIGKEVYMINRTSVNNFSTLFINKRAFGIQDLDNDGVDEFLLSGQNVTIYDENGNLELILNYTTLVQTSMDSRIFKPTSSNIWAFVVYSYTGTIAYNVTAYTPSGSVLWNKIGSSLASIPNCAFAISDYDGDGYDDVYFACITSFQGTQTTRLEIFVFKGSDGTILASDSSANLFGQWGYQQVFDWTPSLTLANLNAQENSKQDFIFSFGNGTYFYDIYSDDILYNRYPYNAHKVSSCIPADLKNTGVLQVICSGDGLTSVFHTNTINSAPIINSVSYSPSLSIQVYQSVTALISATDNDGNQIYYIHNCNTNESFSSPSTSNSQSCTYNSVGIFNFTIGVADSYHGYSYFSQNVYVTETGTSCNNNDICESGLGETSSNCADCSIPDTTTAEGGTAIPTQIVDIENTNQGLLPEIYYGILSFFSYTLQPFIILVFLIFSILIILAFGIVIKKIFHKVADMR